MLDILSILFHKGVWCSTFCCLFYCLRSCCDRSVWPLQHLSTVVVEMPDSWDIAFPLVMTYLVVCLARDILAIVGWVASPHKPVNVKKIEKPSIPCECSSTPKVKEVYVLQGPGHKASAAKKIEG